MEVMLRIGWVWDWDLVDLLELDVFTESESVVDDGVVDALLLLLLSQAS